MKRTISILLSVIMILSLMPFATTTAFADSQGIYSYTITNNEATITDCDRYVSGDITIPSTLGGYPVTTIGRWSFDSCNKLISITIPDSVITIGRGAFCGCNKLISITIPDSVITIGMEAFSGCPKLTSVIIPNSVVSIGDKAFNGCNGILNITIPSSVTSIGDYSFYECININSISIQKGVISIGKLAFSGCISLTSITLPDGIKSIGEWAFSNCASLTYITMPDSIISIGERAFDNCNNIEYNIYNDAIYLGNNKNPYVVFIKPIIKDGASYSVNSNTKLINFAAFADCDKLLNVIIPDGVTSIGDCGFYGCSSLQSITIPKSVTSIGNLAFYGCYSLSNIINASSCIIRGTYNSVEYIFANSNAKLSKVNYIYISEFTFPDKVFGNIIGSIGERSFFNCVNITSLKIPNTVTTIEDMAFEGCTDLTKLAIPESVTSIGKDALLFCNIVVLYVEPDSYAENYAKINNIQYKPMYEYVDSLVKSEEAFKDIKAGQWYVPYTDYAITYKLMKGMSATEFEPTSTLTRAMFVQILANMSGVDTTDRTVTTKFSDVPSGKWYTAAVKWANENKIVTGISETIFGPENPIERQQMCVMLARYADLKGITLKEITQKTTFSDDASISLYARDAVYKCQMAGIVNGMDKTSNNFAPSGNATRGQIAKIVSIFHHDYMTGK